MPASGGQCAWGAPRAPPPLLRASGTGTHPVASLHLLFSSPAVFARDDLCIREDVCKQFVTDAHNARCEDRRSSHDKMPIPLNGPFTDSQIDNHNSE